MIALSRILMPLVSITSSELHLLLRSNGMQEILNAGANVVKMFSGPQWTRQFNLVANDVQCDDVVLRRDAAGLPRG